MDPDSKTLCKRIGIINIFYHLGPRKGRLRTYDSKHYGVQYIYFHVKNIFIHETR